ncbi:hypothetical protein ESCAB7627_2713 [Escherichia albertii TW07627]|uniref:Uncharacterized protein n=1 Tax=Escherichia albertii (strain TW07627) TaxID=502347 RepID=A0ABC9NNF8_ESCAT|nr:hypothetical protein EAKF1_ch0073 [Escherichia albertii KF1]EDS91806.1 hypothetical protein ESCAB7627_2713 [Escherichia albertii TW07627]
MLISDLIGGQINEIVSFAFRYCKSDKPAFLKDKKSGVIFIKHSFTLTPFNI